MFVYFPGPHNLALFLTGTKALSHRNKKIGGLGLGLRCVLCLGEVCTGAVQFMVKPGLYF